MYRKGLSVLHYAEWTAWDRLGAGYFKVGAFAHVASVDSFHYYTTHSFASYASESSHEASSLHSLVWTFTQSSTVHSAYPACVCLLDLCLGGMRICLEVPCTCT